jgi:hypothetical protein
MSGQKWLLIAIFLGVLYNLGAALYYMYTDKGETNRTVRSLTWRIGLSLGLVGIIIFGILTGLIEPHGIQPGQ